MKLTDGQKEEREDFRDDQRRTQEAISKKWTPHISHTATPYTIKKDKAGCACIYSRTNVEVASHLTMEDAAFIVRAVNAHQELLDVICMLVEQPDEYRLSPDQIERYAALIARAEGKS